MVIIGILIALIAQDTTNKLWNKNNCMVIQELKEVEKIVNPNTHLEALIGANRYLILKFYTQTCPPCKKLQTKLEEMRKQGLLNDVFILSIDAKEYPQLVESYKVKSVPAIFVLKDGKVLYNAVGIDEVNYLFEKLLPQYEY